jgi:hypothetical protein
MISETLYPKVFISSQKSGYDLKLLCISNYDSNFNANGAKAIAIL